MTRPARFPFALALALALAACTPSRRRVAPARPIARDAGAAARPDAAPPPDAATAADPCDLRAAVALRLRPIGGRGRVAALPAGTALDLLAVLGDTRGPLDRLGVLSRVRVRATGAEGDVYLDASAVRRCQDHRASGPDIAEARAVTVDGVEEVWRVRFTSPPTPPEEIPEDELTCPDRFAMRFDRGRAVLERVRAGVVVDRFDDPCTLDQAREHDCRFRVPWRVAPWRGGRPVPVAARAGLPRISLLDLGDYDHDGRATEFAMDVAHIVCGHATSVVVGVTRDAPRLHVLRWADGTPMELSVGAGHWDAVRASPRGELVTWGCGDHGMEGEERLRWRPAGARLAAEVVSVPMTDDCRPRDGGAPDDG